MSFDYFRSLVRQAWASLRSRPGLTATVTLLAGWLYGTTPEVAPLGVVVAVVLIVSIAASAWPIVRATRLSPMVALTRR